VSKILTKDFQYQFSWESVRRNSDCFMPTDRLANGQT